MGLYFAFFLISGYCSLVYEVVWLRLAMAQFGVTTPFISIVLSVFMGGLALGSWSVGVVTRRAGFQTRVVPLRLYATAEIVIGLSALIVPIVFGLGRAFVAPTASGVAWDSGSYYLASGAWIALALLPPCFAMGATYPLAMAAMRREFGKHAERSFSYLYLANVVGAAAGTLISAFVLIELFGFHGTLRLSAALNGILAITAFLRSSARVAEADRGPADWSTPSSATPHARRGVGILAGLFVTGLTSMAMEVVWIRYFTFYIGTVVYAFASVLALYLAATFLGSKLYRFASRTRESGDSTGIVVYAWSIAALFALLPLVTGDPRIPLHAWRLPEIFRVVVGIVPFCAAVGFLTPMMIDRWSSGDPERAGTAYATNVLGSLLGPLLAGFWLLPAMGERSALIVLSLPLFAIALTIVLRPAFLMVEGAVPGGARTGVLALSGAVAASVLMIVNGQSWEEVLRQPTDEARRDHTATAIAATSPNGKMLVINGRTHAYRSPLTKTMAHLPLAFLDRPPDNALVVAFGMGTTFRSLVSWNIDTTAVELVPSVPALFGHFHRDAAQVLASPRARVVIDDGRRFLDRSTELYDVITIDPPPPAEAAASSLLYSQEFYTTVRAHLRPHGILQQWVPHTELPIVASVARALRDSFPHVRAFLYQERGTSGFHFLASAQPIPITPGAVLASRLPQSAAADFIEWGPASTAERQFDSILAGEMAIDAVIALAPDAPAIRDDRPFNEYYFLRRWVLQSPTNAQRLSGR
jgi:spermidine synthase